MNEDDDLPILTQVLRTGNAPPAAVIDPRLDDAFHEHFDIHPFDDGPLSRQIVIGHDAQESPVADDASVVADPHEAGAHDPFGLAQDADARHGMSFASTIVEPPMHLAGSVAPPMHDTPIDFSVPSATAEWAARVRDAVVDDLATRIDTELDARIANALHLEVETVLAQLQARLRTHLKDALRDVVARAVDEEIVRIRRSHGGADPH
jgi:hypothetical protein